jgi:hypothetical protein
MRETLRAIKERHYMDWLDESIPALGGMTPRAAAQNPRRRPGLENLLKSMENREARVHEDERFDMRRLRRELGFES